MYILKKSILMTILIALFTLSIGMTAVGQDCNVENNKGTIIFFADEITDQNILYQRAIHNISDTNEALDAKALLVASNGDSDLIDMQQTYLQQLKVL